MGVKVKEALAADYEEASRDNFIRVSMYVGCGENMAATRCPRFCIDKL